ncbi:GNAT family N-acetyltransferase [Mycetocola zhadangensis]|uniref:GNAT family N-acetyltransferase n=1 Tax=Mycetocola zhadangensis TaxID=1164595 RepID=A0A3L7J2K3_9MICO|nr:GNAT family N-acetyltransferase [Mycetocola zhadangensis]RLQ84505.1 GNAT family N-acetyltransferase [Mycetocola zhadangensis]GGE92381.1 N-acetyltransferase [Mycetocola zhadangensis]
MQQPAPALAIERRDYSHPDTRRLVEQLQNLYVRIYGGPDETPIDDSDFSPPHGAVAVGYVDGEPVAMGAWRRMSDGKAELKRMFVVDSFRGRGFSRAVLSWLEESAYEHGSTVMMLETNENHPSAIALYRSVGYRDVPHFGFYASNPMTVSLARVLRGPIGASS